MAERQLEAEGRGAPNPENLVARPYQASPYGWHCGLRLRSSMLDPEMNGTLYDLAFRVYGFKF